jgi:hypothetical protein
MKGIGYAIVAVLMMAMMSPCLGDNGNVTLPMDMERYNIYHDPAGIWGQKIITPTYRGIPNGNSDVFINPEKIMVTPGVDKLSLGKINDIPNLFVSKGTTTYNLAINRENVDCSAGSGLCDWDWVFGPTVYRYLGDLKWLPKPNDTSDYPILPYNRWQTN